MYDYVIVDSEPLDLADQLTLFKPWGADYARHTTDSPHPPTPNSKYYLLTPLPLKSEKISYFKVSLPGDFSHSNISYD